MLVYGENSWTGDPRRRLSGLADCLTAIEAETLGIRRHELLVAALIEAGEIAQGIADADFYRYGEDRGSEAQAAAMRLLMTLSRAVWTSWRSGFKSRSRPEAGGLTSLQATALPESITTRWAEGFAFYALYPESYAMAAARSALPSTTWIVGIRSIGAPLGAMVAAGLDAKAPVTVRPVGHPFHRVLALGSSLTESLIAGIPRSFAIADEGPGLSGSSFGAVMDVLNGLGISERSIALFPSHHGPPGPQAKEEHRARWDRMERYVVPFEDVVLKGRPGGGLASWVADLVGPAEAPLVEISGGRWRAHQGRVEADWPPVDAQQERRKFLLKAGGVTWLVRFAGLGCAGRAKVERARALHMADFGPPVAGYRHGFLVERWVEEARPLDLCATQPDDLADQVGRYLGFRARTFGSEPARGASIEALLAMARQNIGEALGCDWARALDRWTPDRVADFALRAHPVEVDGRMQPWKFLVRRDGHIVKCDAVDHHAGHDMVGCQDIAWDVAGAVIELGLSMTDRTRLTQVVACESGRPIDPNLLTLLVPCYLAFRLGAVSMAADAAFDTAEALRLRRLARRYADHLRRLLNA